MIARRRRFGLHLPGSRTVAVLVAVLALLGGGWVWLRHSSLVAVQRVTISGVRGPDAHEIRSALILAARGMSTLDVRVRDLDAAVSPYPVVKRLAVSAEFPHGLRIRVFEQEPVAVLVAEGQRTPVSSDGTLLRDVAPAADLPSIFVAVPPGGSRVTGSALSETRLLAAAPWQLLAKVSEATSDAAHGLTVRLRRGPRIYFGEPSELGSKWAAADAVLASPTSAGAAYIDVTDPGRPAAGTGSD
jgi:cell division protein FtsQ